MKTPAWPGLTVTLHSNGEDLPEYDVSSSNAENHNASGFVECTDGDTFAINIEVSSLFEFNLNDLLFEIYIDGKWVDGSYSHPSQSGERKTRTCHVDGAGKNDADGNGICHKFAFAKLETDDVVLAPHSKGTYKGFGEVVVKAHRVKCVPGESKYQNRRVSLPSYSVPQKLLKGRSVSNRVCLKEAQRVDRFTFVDCEYPWGQEPFAVYTFHYRSRADLQIEGLISRTPSPVPLEERDPSTLSPEEAREAMLILQQKNTKHLVEKDAEAKWFKRELKRLQSRADESSNTLHPVSSDDSWMQVDPSSRPLKSQATVIDLSED